MNLNVVIIGHVDHGKSTLIGRLLYDSESVKEERVREIQKLAEEYKKRFEFAYFLDAFEDELREERTIDTTGVMFKSKNYYTITDVPGHKEFIKNMLTGASYADCAVLVVSCSQGVEEQTRRHTFLTNLLGIRKLIVAINKMDEVEYRKERFEEIKEKVKKLLSSFGYSHSPFIPISAMEGDNVYKKSSEMDWYTGPTLVETLDSIEVERKEKPLRFVVQGTYSTGSEKIILGRVESGILRKGDELIFEPSGVKGKLKKIKVFEGEKDIAKEKDSVGIIFDGNVERGDVAGSLNIPPYSAREFIGEAVLLTGILKEKAVLLTGILKEKDALQLKCGTKKVYVKVEKIKEKIDSETGGLIEKNPEKIKTGEAAIIHFSTQPLVVEKFSELPELGRFVLVKDNQNIAAGIVLEASV